MDNQPPAIDGDNDQNLLVDTVMGSNLLDLQLGKVCYIDEETIKSLELIENNLEPRNRDHSLYGAIKATKTSCGAKTLKSNMIRPVAHLATIEERLDCVEYLVNHLDVLALIQAALNKLSFIDLEHLINELVHSSATNRQASIKTAEKRLEILINVRRMLTCVRNLTDAMVRADQTTIASYCDVLQDPSFDSICNEIDDVIRRDFIEDKKLKKGDKRDLVNAIKSNKELLLDLTRKTYLEAMSDMEDYVEELALELSLPLKLNHQMGRGYYLQLNKDILGPNFKMPSIFQRIFTTRNILTFTTTDLMRCNVRVNMSYENTLKMSNELLESLINRVTSYSTSLFKILEVVGFIDMIIGFAEISYDPKRRLVKPQFNTKGMEIIGGRHMILETVLEKSQEKARSNNTFLMGHNFTLITGPNMGGKTVYLKQVAIIQIMAQMGCYVPAESANLIVHDRITVRSGSDNEFESNCSSFMNEMKGLRDVLRDDAGNSLVIIDELGRGTSYEDGASYSFAVAEELALRRNVFTLFATHFPLLRSLDQLYNNVKVCQFRMKEDDSKLIFSHELEENTFDDVHYGLKLAEYSAIPKEIIEIARSYLATTYIR